MNRLFAIFVNFTLYDKYYVTPIPHGTPIIYNIYKYIYRRESYIHPAGKTDYHFDFIEVASLIHLAGKNTKFFCFYVV